MGWKTLKQRLVEAEERIVLSNRHIVSQRALIADLAQKGYDTTEATRLLTTFEELHVLYLASCDRLRRELNAQSG